MKVANFLQESCKLAADYHLWHTAAIMDLALLVAAVFCAAPPFEFAPTALPATQALNLVNASGAQPAGRTTTWGGSAIADPAGDGTHHLFASGMAGTNATSGTPCGLACWETNSRVLHAVSRVGAAGPYRVADVSVPPFAHNPEIVYSKREGLWLLFRHCPPS